MSAPAPNELVIYDSRKASTAINMLIVHLCTHDKVYLESLTHAPSRVRGPSRTVHSAAANGRRKASPHTARSKLDSNHTPMLITVGLACASSPTGPARALDPWLLLLSSQPPALVIEALRQHVFGLAASCRLSLTSPKAKSGCGRRGREIFSNTKQLQHSHVCFVGEGCASS